MPGRRAAPKRLHRSQMRISRGPELLPPVRRHKYTSMPNLEQMKNIVGGSQQRRYDQMAPHKISKALMAKAAYKQAMQHTSPPRYCNFGLFMPAPALRPLREAEGIRPDKPSISETWGYKSAGASTMPGCGKDRPGMGTRHRFHFKGSGKTMLYETPWNTVEPVEFPRLQPKARPS